MIQILTRDKTIIFIGIATSEKPEHAGQPLCGSIKWTVQDTGQLKRLPGAGGRGAGRCLTPVVSLGVVESFPSRWW